jgi:hypothetical protein
MASKMKDEATLNQQVEELRERMRILRKLHCNRLFLTNRAICEILM